MEASDITKVTGPPAFVAFMSLTFPNLPVWFGTTGMGCAAILTLHGFWPVMIQLCPFLARVYSTPMSFHELAHHVAFKSLWASRYVPSDRDALSDLKAEICRPLIRASSPWATGLKSTKAGEENGTAEIPTDFWKTAHFPLALQIQEQGPGANFASAGTGDFTVFYSEIVFDRRKVLKEWATHKSWRKTRSFFLKLAASQKRQSDEALEVHQRDWWTQNGPTIFGPDWDQALQAPRRGHPAGQKIE